MSEFERLVLTNQVAIMGALVAISGGLGNVRERSDFDDKLIVRMDVTAKALGVIKQEHGGHNDDTSRRTTETDGSRP